ncbi:MAG: hypothetical protein BroJett006_07140 [Betaproteobacteria bacterium]|nr:MAG: hypothetical protein BroJett006_07140 [Betaproteobacteria bacterium]
MHVFAAINRPTDKPYWVSRSSFFEYFDQGDFLNRDIVNVTPAYLNDWFHTDDHGRQRFYIPVVSTISGHTDLIGSRHRLAVLLPYLEELPFAFAMGHLHSNARRVLDMIPKRLLNPSVSFWVPDLPRRKKLP